MYTTVIIYYSIKMLPTDIINYLCQITDNVTINNFLSVNKSSYELKFKIKFCHVVTISNKILQLPYYNNFSAIIINFNNFTYDETFAYPTGLQYLVLHDLPKCSIPSTVTSLVNYTTLFISIPLSVKYCCLKINKASDIKMLPSSIKKLMLLEISQRNEDLILPQSLTHFMFMANDRSRYDNIRMPNTLEYLFLYDSDKYYSEFFPELKLKKINRSFSRPLFSDLNISNLPNLKYLDVGFNNIKVGSIPTSVTHLTFGDGFDQKLEPGFISSSVTHLIFSSRYNKELNAKSIPSSVEYLTIYKSLLDDCILPSNIKIISP